MDEQDYTELTEEEKVFETVHKLRREVIQQASKIMTRGNQSEARRLICNEADVDRHIAELALYYIHSADKILSLDDDEKLIPIFLAQHDEDTIAEFFHFCHIGHHGLIHEYLQEKYDLRQSAILLNYIQDLSRNCWTEYGEYEPRYHCSGCNTFWNRSHYHGPTGCCPKCGEISSSWVLVTGRIIHVVVPRVTKRIWPLKPRVEHLKYVVGWDVADAHKAIIAQRTQQEKHESTEANTV